jgi:hypothetical protein
MCVRSDSCDAPQPFSYIWQLMTYYIIPITIVLGGIVVAMTLLRRRIKSNSNNTMSKSIFLILMIIFASLSNTIGVSAANANGAMTIINVFFLLLLYV